MLTLSQEIGLCSDCQGYVLTIFFLWSLALVGSIRVFVALTDSKRAFVVLIDSKSAFVVLIDSKRAFVVD